MTTMMKALLGQLLLMWMLVCDCRTAFRPADKRRLICRRLHRCSERDDYMNTLHDKGCWCDRLCKLYGDCCERAAALDHDWGRLADMGAAASCQQRPHFTQLRHDIYVIERCPPDYANATVARLCDYSTDHSDNGVQTDSISSTPVSEATHGFVFRNKYCAICWGWQLSDVTYWLVNVTCQVAEEQLAEVTTAADLSAQSETESGRSASVETPASQREDQLMGEYDVTMTTEATNNPSLSSLMTAAVDIIRQATECHVTYIQPAEIVAPRQCQVATSSCRPGWGDVSIRDECHDGYTGYVYEESGAAYKNRFCAACNGLARTDIRCNPSVRRDPRPHERDPSVLSISVLLDFNQPDNSHSGMGPRRMEHRCPRNYRYDRINKTCRPVVCDGATTAQGPTCVNADVSPYGNLSDTLARCPKIQLNESEYQIYDNDSMTITASGQTFSDGEYISVNTTILVCASDYIMPHRGRGQRMMHGPGHRTQRGIGEGLVSLVGQTISLVSLLVLLLVYCCCPPLRTVPGKCLMCLAASLFIAQLLFVIGIFTRDHRTLCRTIAILTHFSFLLSFAWMNVMSFDIWRTFHRRMVVSNAPQRVRSFRRYVVYATAVPLIIVGTAVTMDCVHLQQVASPKYGHRFCWINDGKALLIYFGLPVLIFIISNYTLFGLAVYHIYKASSDTEILRQSKSNQKRKRLVLYTKLSTIMGLTWLFGFLASATDATALWYLFVIFNTLQGLFICIAFLLNRKIIRLFKKRFGMEKRKSAAVTQSTSSPSVEMTTRSPLMDLS